MIAGDDGQAIYIEEQRLCFIDDLIIEKPDSRKHSQLKRGASTGWTSGTHPIAEDFRLQYRLDTALGIQAEYELVVPPALQAGLAAARPDDVKAEVIGFSSTSCLDELFDEHPEIAEALDEISIRTPKASVRRQQFKTLLGAWAVSGARISLADFALTAAEGPGPLVAVPGPEYVLPVAVADQLRKVPGLDFEMRKKHLWYRFGSATGVSSARGGSEAFTSFEEFVASEKPTDGFEIIAALMECA